MPAKTLVDLAVVTDSHLFHPYSYIPARVQLALLQQVEPEQMLVTGDLVDYEAIVNFLHNELHIPFREFPTDFTEVLKKMRCTERPFPNLEFDITVLNTIFHIAAQVPSANGFGNHDASWEGLEDNDFEGMMIRKRGTVWVGGKKYLYEHGDDFDPLKLGLEKEGPHEGKNLLGYYKRTSGLTMIMALDHFMHTMPMIRKKLPSYLQRDFAFSNAGFDIGNSEWSRLLLPQFAKWRRAGIMARMAAFHHLTEINENLGPAEKEYDGLLYGHYHSPKVTKIKLPKIEEKTLVDSGDGLTHGTLGVHDRNGWNIRDRKNLPAGIDLFRLEEHQEQRPKSMAYLQTGWFLTLWHLAQRLDEEHGILEIKDIFKRDPVLEKPQEAELAIA